MEKKDYLQGKIIIYLGHDFTREYTSGEHHQSLEDIQKWKSELFNRLPSCYLKFGEIKTYVKRVYPQINTRIYTSKWIEI